MSLIQTRFSFLFSGLRREPQAPGSALPKSAKASARRHCAVGNLPGLASGSKMSPGKVQEAEAALTTQVRKASRQSGVTATSTARGPRPRVPTCCGSVPKLKLVGLFQTYNATTCRVGSIPFPFPHFSLHSCCRASSPFLFQLIFCLVVRRCFFWKTPPLSLKSLERP